VTVRLPWPTVTDCGTVRGTVADRGRPTVGVADRGTVHV